MASETGSISATSRSTASDAWPAVARHPLMSTPAPLHLGSSRIARRAMPARSRGEAS
jgi:hypothetical protein